jgi:hypothetical protein
MSWDGAKKHGAASAVAGGVLGAGVGGIGTLLEAYLLKNPALLKKLPLDMLKMAGGGALGAGTLGGIAGGLKDD